ncbi:Pectin acetylesterase 8 [Abeliophyllum distichum]|uniref:Pectin acetylesterase n=1 Tax=Abeliophyllum distichum TaxID=126358 RepID=A0ABD1NRL3_9LAMI
MFKIRVGPHVGKQKIKKGFVSIFDQANKLYFRGARVFVAVIEALVPTGAKVKCFADAGYFINAKDVSGAQHIENFYDDVVKTHGAAKNLPSSCTSKGKPSLCFFPQYMSQQIQTPLFITNAAHDSWQL